VRNAMGARGWEKDNLIAANNSVNIAELVGRNLANYHIHAAAAQFKAGHPAIRHVHRHIAAYRYARRQIRARPRRRA